MTLALFAVGWFGLADAAGGGDDPGARAVRQQLLQRQQQQEALQLRMQQQQLAAPNPPRDARQKQAQERLQVEQRQWQQDVHYRQSVEPAAVQPSDDEGTRRAKEDRDRQKAQQQGQALLRRFEAGQLKK